jgi:hypothetical protein
MKTLLPLTLLAASLPAMAAQPDLLPVEQIGLERAHCAASALKKVEEMLAFGM